MFHVTDQRCILGFTLAFNTFDKPFYHSVAQKRKQINMILKGRMEFYRLQNCK